MREFSHLEDREDSGMISTEQGTPFTIGECLLWYEKLPYASYEKQLVYFMLRRLERLAGK